MFESAILSRSSSHSRVIGKLLDLLQTHKTAFRKTRLDERNPLSAEGQRLDLDMDRVDVTGQSWSGLSMTDSTWDRSQRAGIKRYVSRQRGKGNIAQRQIQGYKMNMTKDPGIKDPGLIGWDGQNSLLIGCMQLYPRPAPTLIRSFVWYMVYH